MRFSLCCSFLRAGALASLAGLLSACVSVPMGAAEDAARAKRFEVAPEKAALYIAREDLFVGGGVLSPVMVGDKTVGSLKAGTFVRVDVPPGKHFVRALSAERVSQVEIDVEGGKACYLLVEPQFGLIGSWSVERIGEARGREVVAKGQLIAPF